MRLMYWSDWSLGQRNRFYRIGVFGGVGGEEAGEGKEGGEGEEVGVEREEEE